MQNKWTAKKSRIGEFFWNTKNLQNRENKQIARKNEKQRKIFGKIVFQSGYLEFLEWVLSVSVEVSLSFISPFRKYYYALTNILYDGERTALVMHVYMHINDYYEFYAKELFCFVKNTQICTELSIKYITIIQ